MSADDDRPAAAATGADAEDLALRVARLEAEADRLRSEYALAGRLQYRRTALAFLATGLVAIAGGILFADARSVLFALGGTGVFGAVLTAYLTPERFLAADVGERVYTALADNGSALVEDLGLSDARVYARAEGVGPDGGVDPVRLFVPQHVPWRLPPTDALTSPLVVTDAVAERGLSLQPTGAPLFAAFDRARHGPPADAPAALGDQLTDALVEQFELVTAATTDVGEDGRVITVGVTGSAFGAIDRFDHPVASFLAVGCVRGLETPVAVSVEEGGDHVDQVVAVRRLEHDQDATPSADEGSNDTGEGTNAGPGMDRPGDEAGGDEPGRSAVDQRD